MKKLLKILGVFIFANVSTLSVISCSNEKVSFNSLSSTQKDMIEGASFISKLIIAGKHENLNYNANEILSMYLTTSQSAMNMPVTYKYNDKNINIGGSIKKYTDLLAPALNDLDPSGFASMMTSYVMGMYGDDFYENIIKGDSLGKKYFKDTYNIDGYTGTGKTGTDNAMGYAAGLNKEFKLSNDSERKDLAWGIQDMGGLTNFLLAKGYDGAYPGDTNGTVGAQSSPSAKYGTNGQGYAWYNSQLWKGQATKLSEYQKSCGKNLNEDCKISHKLDLDYTKSNSDTDNNFNSTIKIGEKNYDFNGSGALISTASGKMKIQAYIANFGSVLQNITESDIGASILFEFLNYTTPLIRESVFSATPTAVTQEVATKLINGFWSGLNNIKKNEEIKEILSNNGIEISYLDKINGDPGADIQKQTGYDFATNEFNESRQISILNIIKMIEEFVEYFESEDNIESKNDFMNKLFFEKDSPFYKGSYDTVIDGVNVIVVNVEGIGIDNWKATLKEDGSGAAKLLNLIKRTYEDFSNVEMLGPMLEKVNFLLEQFAKENNLSKIDKLSQLNPQQKKKLIEAYGYNSSSKTFKKGSYMYRAFNGLKNPNTVGAKEFEDFFNLFGETVAAGMKKPHEEVLQYMYEDEYWKMDNYKVSSTSNQTPGAKISFTLNYSGVGDPTSNANQQTEKLIDLNKKSAYFNPYQTIFDYQLNGSENIKPKLSGKDWVDKKLVDESLRDLSGIPGVLRKDLMGDNNIWTDEELINYDGLGDYRNFENVNHSYEVEWENISKDPLNPYWVIVKLKSFNKDGKEFYNMY